MKLRQAVEAGNVGLWDWDLVTNRVYYSAEWKRQIGFADDESLMILKNGEAVSIQMIWKNPGKSTKEYRFCKQKPRGGIQI